MLSCPLESALSSCVFLVVYVYSMEEAVWREEEGDVGVCVGCFGLPELRTACWKRIEGDQKREHQRKPDRRNLNKSRVALCGLSVLLTAGPSTLPEETAA